MNKKPEWLKDAQHKILQHHNGRYFVDIDITISEWESMLQDPHIFFKEALKMVLAWYQEEDFRATSKTIILKHNPTLKGTPYNGIVKGLSNRILNHLKRFWVEDKYEEIGKNFIEVNHNKPLYLSQKEHPINPEKD